MNYLHLFTLPQNKSCVTIPKPVGFAVISYLRPKVCARYIHWSICSGWLISDDSSGNCPDDSGKAAIWSRPSLIFSSIRLFLYSKYCGWKIWAVCHLLSFRRGCNLSFRERGGSGIARRSWLWSCAADRCSEEGRVCRKAVVVEEKGFFVGGSANISVYLRRVSCFPAGNCVPGDVGSVFHSLITNKIP